MRGLNQRVSWAIFSSIIPLSNNSQGSVSGVDVGVRRETGDPHGLGSELWGKSARGQVGNMGWLERSEEFGDSMLGRSSLPPRSVQAVGTLLQNPSQIRMMLAACPELSLKPCGHLPIT